MPATLATQRPCIGDACQSSEIVYFAKVEPRNVVYGKVFLCVNAIYGCSGLGNCRMLTCLSKSFCVIDLISMLIMSYHSITNIFRIELSRDFVVVFIPTFSTIRISNKMVKYSHRPPQTENQHAAIYYMMRQIGHSP